MPDLSSPRRALATLDENPGRAPEDRFIRAARTPSYRNAALLSRTRNSPSRALKNKDQANA
jgi:hypothetical protein